MLLAGLDSCDVQGGSAHTGQPGAARAFMYEYEYSKSTRMHTVCVDSYYTEAKHHFVYSNMILVKLNVFPLTASHLRPIVSDPSQHSHSRVGAFPPAQIRRVRSDRIAMSQGKTPFAHTRLPKASRRSFVISQSAQKASSPLGRVQVSIDAV
jgi:hypothetical protein